MVESLIVFSLLTWGLAFLISDASLFGCSTKTYLLALDDENPDEAESVLREEGVLRARNTLLRVGFLRRLLGCYFCVGVWCGPMAHLLLYSATGSGIMAIRHPNTVQGWTTSLAATAVLGGACCYVVDLVVGALERLQPD